MSGARSRNKGHNYERELVLFFRRWFPTTPIKRGLGQTRGGGECPNVEMRHIWIVAKRGKKTNIKAALRQAIEAKDERVPIAVCRDDHAEATATLLLSDFMPMLKSWLDEEMAKEVEKQYHERTTCDVSVLDLAARGKTG